MNFVFPRWLLGSLASFSLMLASGCDSRPTAAASAAPAAIAPVITVSPAAGPSLAATPAADGVDAKAYVTTGPLVAEQQADVGPERDGLVTRIAVQIGDHVRQGQLLAALDDRVLRVACEQQRAHVASLQSQVREWQAEQQTEEADLRRADRMRDAKIISEENWEHVKYKLDETIQEVARYKADEAAAEADLNAANLQLEQSRILAPFSGVVGRSTVRVDQEVKKGDALFWVTAEAPLRVLFTVPESAMAPFKTGAALELSTGDYPGLRQEARIVRVSPVVDPASGSVQVIGAVVHPSPLLKPGMSMSVQLADGQAPPARGPARRAP